MVRQERWEEIRRLFHIEGAIVSEIARRLELDRKTVRRCVAQPAWRPYRRPARTDTLLAESRVARHPAARNHHPRGCLPGRASQTAVRLHRPRPRRASRLAAPSPRAGGAQPVEQMIANQRAGLDRWVRSQWGRCRPTARRRDRRRRA
jgi:hypothetical protein